MARYDTFTFRVNPEERQMIEALAEKLQRSPSDTVRLLVRGAAQGAGLDAPNEQRSDQRGERGNAGDK